ncbi:proline dehydrogenase 1, mitochondrial isoform X2 [Hydra vulgaris]|uniref:Proline dehydrogenase n=1 Tax=Hydra vulgaris TaxID=6087 RepID=A0ABM4CQW4_HYDVU
MAKSIKVIQWKRCELLSLTDFYPFMLKRKMHDVNMVKTECKGEPSIDFSNFEQAFRAKTTGEIIKAIIVYKLCSIDFLVNRNKELMSISRKIFGKKGFDYIMKSSFYGHFVAGESQEDIKSKLELMKKFGVGAILDYAVESDIPQKEPAPPLKTLEKIDELQFDIADIEKKFKRNQQLVDRRQRVVSARTYFYEGEEKCDENMEVFIKCIDKTGETSTNGFAAIKVTALGRPLMLLRLSQILNQTKYYFDVIAAENQSILSEKAIAEQYFLQGLHKLGVSMTPEEAKKIFKIIDTNNNGGIDIIEWKNFLTPQLQLSKIFRAKPTAEGKSGENGFIYLSSPEVKEMEKMQDRLHCIVERAKEKNVRLMVDAEQTYFQPAISHMTLEAMRNFNKDSAIIFNTYQCYLKDTIPTLCLDIELSRREGFYFAAKVVRGAYMEQERFRAHSVGYSDPIHVSYEATNESYNNVLSLLLEEVRHRKANIMVATHNEASVLHAINTMKKFGIKPDDKTVFFGQLLGMCDVITYALGSAGYAAYKYVPYGPVEDVMPYLSRRAMENRSLMKGVIKERSMLWSELGRRFRNGALWHNPSLIANLK